MLRLCCLAWALPAGSPLGGLQGQLLERGILLCLAGFLHLRGCRQGQTAVGNLYKPNTQTMWQVQVLQSAACRCWGLPGAFAACQQAECPAARRKYEAHRLLQFGADEGRQSVYHARQEGPAAHSCTLRALALRLKAHSTGLPPHAQTHAAYGQRSIASPDDWRHLSSGLRDTSQQRGGLVKATAFVDGLHMRMLVSDSRYLVRVTLTLSVATPEPSSPRRDCRAKFMRMLPFDSAARRCTAGSADSSGTVIR